MSRVVELKFYDRYVIQTGETTTQVPWIKAGSADIDANLLSNQVYILPLVTGIKTGANAYERVGRKITVRSILLDLGFSGILTNAFNKAFTAKLWLVHDKQANGQIFTGSNVFQTALGGDGLNGPTAGVDLVTQLSNIPNKSRFNILKEVTMTFTPQIDGANLKKHVRIYKKCNMDIEYSAGTGAIGEIKSNNIGCLFAFTTEDFAVNEANVRMRVMGSTRIRYLDA